MRRNRLRDRRKVHRKTDVETHKKLLQALNCMENDIDVFTKIFGILWEQKYVNWQVASALINKAGHRELCGNVSTPIGIGQTFQANGGKPRRPGGEKHLPASAISPQSTMGRRELFATDLLSKERFLPHKRQQQSAPSRY